MRRVLLGVISVLLFCGPTGNTRAAPATPTPTVATSFAELYAQVLRTRTSLSGSALADVLRTGRALAQARLGRATRTSGFESEPARAILFITWPRLSTTYLYNAGTTPNDAGTALNNAGTGARVPEDVQAWFDYAAALRERGVTTGGMDDKVSAIAVQGVTTPRTIWELAGHPTNDPADSEASPTFWRMVNRTLDHFASLTSGSDSSDPLDDKSPPATVIQMLQQLHRYGVAAGLIDAGSEHDIRLQRLMRFTEFRQRVSQTGVIEEVQRVVRARARGQVIPNYPRADAALAALADALRDSGGETMGAAIAWREYLSALAAAPPDLQIDENDAKWSDLRAKAAASLNPPDSPQAGPLTIAGHLQGIRWCAGVTRGSFEHTLTQLTRATDDLVAARRQARLTDPRLGTLPIQRNPVYQLYTDARTRIGLARTASENAFWGATIRERTASMSDISVLQAMAEQGLEWVSIAAHLDEIKGAALPVPPVPKSVAEARRFAEDYLARPSLGYEAASPLSQVTRLAEALDDGPTESLLIAAEKLKASVNSLRIVAHDAMLRTEAEHGLDTAALLLQSAGLGQRMAEQAMLIAQIRERAAASQRRLAALGQEIANLEKERDDTGLQLARMRLEIRRKALDDAAELVVLQEAAVAQSEQMCIEYNSRVKSIEEQVLSKINNIEDESHRRGIFSFFRALARIVCVVAAPFTGGSSLSLIGPIDTAIGIVEKATAINWNEPAQVLGIARDAVGTATALGVDIGRAVPADVGAWFRNPSAEAPPWLRELPTEAQSVLSTLKEAGVSTKLDGGKLVVGFAAPVVDVLANERLNGLSDWASEGAAWPVGGGLDDAWQQAAAALREHPDQITDSKALFERVRQNLPAGEHALPVADIANRLTAASQGVSPWLDDTSVTREDGQARLRQFAAAMSLRAIPWRGEQGWRLAIPAATGHDAAARLNAAKARVEELNRRMHTQQVQFIRTLESELKGMQANVDGALQAAQQGDYNGARAQIKAAAALANGKVREGIDAVKRQLDEARASAVQAQQEVALGEMESLIAERQKNIALLGERIAMGQVEVADLEVEASGEGVGLAQLGMEQATVNLLAVQLQYNLAEARSAYYKSLGIRRLFPASPASLAHAVSDGYREDLYPLYTDALSAVRELLAWRRLLGVSDRTDTIQAFRRALAPLQSRFDPARLFAAWDGLEPKVPKFRSPRLMETARSVPLEVLLPEEVEYVNAVGRLLPTLDITGFRPVGVARVVSWRGTSPRQIAEPDKEVSVFRSETVDAQPLTVLLNQTHAWTQRALPREVIFLVLPPFPWEEASNSVEFQRPAQLFRSQGVVLMAPSPRMVDLPGAYSPLSLLRRSGTWRIIFLCRAPLPQEEDVWEADAQQIRETGVMLSVPALPD